MPGSTRPVVIIGAPRSGTNMLRDLVCDLDGLGTWPCDEIDPIWRYRNQRVPHDELGPELATEPVRRFVRSRFDWVARRYGLHRVVEKTCANSLRVPFVDRILPDAQYLFIVRDGRDAAASAAVKRRAGLKPGYAIRKARFVPPRDLVPFGISFISRRRRGMGEHLAGWGPRCAGPVPEEVLGDPLIASAYQWERCVELSARALGELEPDRVLKVRYEDLVDRPVDHLERIVTFLEAQATERRLEELAKTVVATNVGKWRTGLSEEDAARLDARLHHTLTQHGY